ncbi:MAG: hypothetical protein RIR00_204 [Pseudomonadota bacterium]
MHVGNLRHTLCLGLFVLLVSAPLAAETWRERMHERIQQRGLARQEAGRPPEAEIGAEMAGEGGGDLSCAEWARRINRIESARQSRQPGPSPDRGDVAYGPEPRTRLDVYLPKTRSAGRAPIIVMVHGGGWCVGDKRSEKLTANKVARWVPAGFIFVAINYPMVSDGADALAQAGHVARALAFVQSHAESWGGDAERLLLMGHSAGAHLVSLVHADARLRQANGLRPLLGVISLDAGAIDVVRQMPRVYPFLKTRYREAFGEHEAQWVAASPFHRLEPGASPWLGVCSTRRQDDPCGQAQAYAEKSRALGVPARVLPERMSHGAINDDLGLPGRYTAAVEAFMTSLDPAVASLLKAGSAQR